MKKLLKLAKILLLLAFLLNLGIFTDLFDSEKSQIDKQKTAEYSKIALTAKMTNPEKTDYRQALMDQYRAEFIHSIDSSQAVRLYLSNLLFAILFLLLRKTSARNCVLTKSGIRLCVSIILYPVSIAYLFAKWNQRKYYEYSAEARLRQKSEDIFAELDIEYRFDSSKAKHAFVYALAVTIFLSAMPSMAKSADAKSYGVARAQIENLQVNNLSPSGDNDDAGSTMVCIEHEKIEIKNFIVSVFIHPQEIVERTISRSRRIFHIPEMQVNFS